jgi:hypothetical protein
MATDILVTENIAGRAMDELKTRLSREIIELVRPR